MQKRHVINVGPQLTSFDAKTSHYQRRAPTDLLWRKNIIFFGTLKIGQNDPRIPNLEFENHGFLENQVFLPTEQAGTNIC